MSERQRFWMAVVGAPLWIAYPFIFWFGAGAKWQVRCGGRTFAGAFDDCFNDYIPVLEVMAFPVMLLLTYPFLRFAFTLYAPPVEWRKRAGWWLARNGGGADYYPSLHLFVVLAVLWAAVHLVSYPLAWVTAPFILYWIMWILWLGMGSWASWPARVPDDVG